MNLYLATKNIQAKNMFQWLQMLVIMKSTLLKKTLILCQINYIISKMKLMYNYLLISLKEYYYQTKFASKKRDSHA